MAQIPSSEVILLRVLEALTRDMLPLVPDGHGVEKAAIKSLLDQLDHQREGGSTFPERVYMDIYKLMERRRLIGLESFGHKVEDDAAGGFEWLKHALEENMDQVVYLQAALAKLMEMQNETYRLSRSSD